MTHILELDDLLVWVLLCNIFAEYSEKNIIAVEAKVRTLLNAEIHSEITSDFLLTRSAILRLP
ncbi:MAG: hypothetical protein MGG11_04415 [Trichodesmium sp. MAG_R03]|nr:hypothetical protein [Trichodesmium sp. MAG_R03]